MMDREELLKTLAAYRDLSPAERERLQKVLAEDPAAANLLAEYRDMDEVLAQLPDPAPDDALREAFYQQVQGRRADSWWAPLRQLPEAAIQVGGVAFLLLVVIIAGWLFREQISQPQAAGPVSTARPAAEGTPTPLPQTFAHPTPTYPAEMNLADPFASFAEVMAGWGGESHPSQAFLVMRTAIKIYLQEAGGMAALDDPAVLAGLEERLRPHVPVWPEFALQRADLTGDGQPELIVAVLPLIDVYFEDEDGVVHARGLPQPGHLDVAQAWPHALQLTDLTQDGLPEVLVAFTEGIRPGLVATADARYEVLVARWDPQAGYFSGVLQVPATATAADTTVFGTHVEEEWASVETYCSTYGLFSAPGAPHITQRNVYAWNGVRFELVLYERAEPETVRQYVNLAEAHLQEGDLAGALLFYEALYQDQIDLPDEEAAGGFPDWRAYASLRAAQVQALLGNNERAQAALGRAQLSSSVIGRLAGVFGERLQATGDPAAAWAALLADDALSEGTAEDAGNEAAVRAAILHPGMAVAAALRQHPDLDVAREVEDALRGYEFEVTDLTPEDVDDDGAQEIMVRQLLPGDVAAVSLLERGDEGWFAVLLAYGPADEVPVYQFGERSVRVGDFQVTWDGRHATFSPFTGPQLSTFGGAHLCPLRGDDLVVVQEQPLQRPTVAPTQVLPTLDTRSLTATAEGRAWLETVQAQAGSATAPLRQATPTPTPWRTPTPWTGPADSSATPTPWTPPIEASTPTPVATPMVPQLLSEGLLTFDSWSPSGRYLTYREHTEEALSANPEAPSGTLVVYDSAVDALCRYEGEQVGAGGYGWLEGNVLFFLDGDTLSVEMPCAEQEVERIAAPAPLQAVVGRDEADARFVLRGEDGYWLFTRGDDFAFQRIAGIVPRAGDVAAFSPDGGFLALSTGAGGTTIVATDDGAVVRELAWQPVAGEGTAVQWLGERRLLVTATADQGPLLVEDVEESAAAPVGPTLFGQDADPAQRARGAPMDGAAGGDYLVVLSLPEGGSVLRRPPLEPVHVLDADEVLPGGMGRLMVLLNVRDGLTTVSAASPLAGDLPPLELLQTVQQPVMPAASPGGGWVAVVVGNQVLVADRLGNGEWWHLESYLYGLTPRWSPEGTQLVVMAGLSGRAEQGLYLIPTP